MLYRSPPSRPRRRPSRNERIPSPASRRFVTLRRTRGKLRELEQNISRYAREASTVRKSLGHCTIDRMARHIPNKCNMTSIFAFNTYTISGTDIYVTFYVI